MDTWDLRRLRILRELEQRTTLAAVAAALGYSPSAISQQLAVLEREVGVRLLERAGRGVRLTDAGRLLAQHAGILLAATEAAQADLGSLGGDVRGTVRAAGLQSATRRVLIPALADIQATHPAVRFELTELELEQALPELRLGSLDLVISDEYTGHPRPRPPGLRHEVLVDEPLRVVLPAGHPSAADDGPVSIADLREEVWVASAAGTGHHALVVAACRSHGGFDPDVRHRSNDADVQLELIRSTGAVGLLPVLSLPTADPSLAVRDVVDSTPVTRRLLLLTRDRPPGPALAAVLTAVRAQTDRLVSPLPRPARTRPRRPPR
ncbi:LysR family transcriptional regulator [Nocardioides sp. SYSU D00065]|uniref:LysR substrate-binding domain-containing protein n=1 Tax=Nocardioides sp. SYSU D00065 TaxID=2817378 RepID=UPI001B3256BF|nr:LysR family transcriptional regulator [Nocardioides sp. SYSU D00065]